MCAGTSSYIEEGPRLKSLHMAKIRPCTVLLCLGFERLTLWSKVWVKTTPKLDVTCVMGLNAFLEFLRIEAMVLK